MELVWPTPPPGPRTAARARTALEGVEDGLVAARAALLAAGEVEWVSAAATAYHRLLDDALADVAQLDATLSAAHWPVTRHTEASDTARAAHEAGTQDVFGLPVWRRDATVAVPGAPR